MFQRNTFFVNFTITKLLNPLKLKLIFISLFGLLAISGIAQDSARFHRQPNKERILDKMFFGGNFGLQFGTVTFIEVSPLVGYRITDRIAVGAGLTYEYYHYNDKVYDLKTNVYGGRIFGRYMFTDYLFGHVEYEYLNLEAFDFYRRRVDVDSFLAGGGYMQRIGRNSAMTAMILYNFTESAYTPYTNPVIRIGFNIGF